MNYLLIMLLCMTVAWITRPITVICHELGHAIPALLLTRKKVTVYLGSYGDPEKSVKLRLGLLEVWARLSFFWNTGLCVPSAKEISPNRQSIYTICGPIASFLLALIGIYLIFSFDMHGVWKLLVIFFMGSAIVDLCTNLIPDSTEIILYDGSIIYNDGYQLKLLLSGKQLMKAYEEAAAHYSSGDYRTAATLLEDLLTKDIDNSDYLYRLTISALMQVHEYRRVLRVHEKFQENYSLTSADYANAGLAKSHLGMLQESLLDYDQSLALDPEYVYALNNKGYTLNLMEEYAASIPFFDRALEADASFSHSYSNRGLAKIKLGKVEEGLAEIRHALSLDPNNAYAYKNLGTYHLDKQEYTEALGLFTKALQIDAGTYLIDACIKEASESGILANKADGEVTSQPL